MAIVSVLNQTGNEVKKLELDSSVFDVEYNGQVIYDVVNAQRAAMRQGTHKTKTRTEVRGGGRKPYKQKGTGRARQGSIRAPQWRGGGVAFGPTPRSYAVKVNRKVARLALCVALSEKVRNNNLIVVDNIELGSNKTKEFVNFLNDVKSIGKVVLGTKEINSNLDIASRNVPYAFLETVDHISVYEILGAKTLLLTEEAVKQLEEGLRNE